MVKLELAGIKDADAIMAFIDRHWRRGHILSRHRGLFLYDFQDGERLNFGLARNAGGRIVGLFGFMRYNSRSVPDLAGSLWKVIEDVGEPMLGLRLRRFVLDQVPHRFFAAPGAGLQTRAIYHALRMNWSRMDQYFLVNPTMERYELLRGVEPGSAGLRPMPAGVRTLELKSHGDLAAFDFDAFDHIAPFKDRDYITRRFLNHPIHRYEVHLVLLDDRPACLLVTRIAAHGGRAACRVVDLLGRTDRMDAVAGVLSAMIVRRGCEYADFVCHGLDATAMAEAGFSSVDFESDRVIVPNYFEPFAMRNVPVYCVWDRTDKLTFRQCKADGDQDRPNHFEPSNMAAA